MTVEEYRRRMIQAFHNADCDELIALVVMPTEKEFEQLEWLLKTHYKKQPCEDCVSREAVIVGIRSYWHDEYYQRVPITEEREDLINEVINHLSPVTPKQRTGKWVKHNTGHGVYYDCSQCGCAAPCTETADKILWKMAKYCYDCGAKMEGEGAWI